MADLTAFDIIVLLLVCGGAVRGFMKGFVEEVISLAAWVAAIVAVRLFHAPLTGWLEGRMGDGGAAMLAFVLLFGGLFMAGRFAARQLGQRSRKSLVGAFDRGLGAGFGALKGLLVATLAFMLVTLAYDIITPGDRPGWLVNSRSYVALSASAAAASKVIDERKRAAAEAAPAP